MSGAAWQRGCAELLHELRELESRRRRDHSATVELVAELEIRGAAAECGYSSMKELLRDCLRITPREAQRRIDHAHTLVDAPLVSGGSVPAPLPR